MLCTFAFLPFLRCDSHRPPAGAGLARGLRRCGRFRAFVWGGAKAPVFVGKVGVAESLHLWRQGDAAVPQRLVVAPGRAKVRVCLGGGLREHS